MEKVTIYTMETCGYCKTIKEELKKNNIEFTEKLVDDSREEFNQIVGLTNMSTTPIIHCEDSYLVPARDFSNPQSLINILKNFKKPNFSESKQALEQVKTLNYNMAMAFGRLDQLLRKIEQKIDK
jgi:glutaredoxin 3